MTRLFGTGLEMPGVMAQAGIVLISEFFPPIHGGSAELLMNVYSRVGCDVDVLADGTPEPEEAGRASFRIHRRRFGTSLGVMAPQSGLAHASLARGVRQLARCREVVVHCGRALPEGTVAMFTSVGQNVPFVCWTHGEELPVAASSRELTWLMKRVHRRSAAIFANSENTARLLAGVGVPASKIHVVYPGVDANRFTPRARDSELRESLSPHGELVLLSVGRLQARKGHDLVLRALAQLGSAAHVRFVAIGDGPDRSRLQMLTAELGLSDRVVFKGAVPPAELPAYYASADVFVQPNRVEGSDFEGFGIVFLEAAASGLATIGGRSGGVPEAVADGVTGMLVDGTDAAELATTIRLLGASPELCARLGATGRTRVLRDFTWERAADAVRRVDTDVRAAAFGAREIAHA